MRIRTLRTNGLFSSPFLSAQRRSWSSSSQNSPPKPAAPTGPLPRNLAIPFTEIRVVDPVTGRLGPRELLKDVLKRVPKYGAVQLVQHGNNIARIRTKEELKAEFQRGQDTKDKEKITKHTRKEITLSWGSNDTDFDHKMEKAVAELEQGNSVTIIFASRRSQYHVTPELRHSSMARVDEMLEAVGRRTATNTSGAFTSLQYSPREETKKEAEEIRALSERVRVIMAGMKTIRNQTKAIQVKAVHSKKEKR